jgi:hypothetical protein
LSEVEIGRLAAYDGPTWLDEAIVGKLQVQKELPGFPAELRQALADRGRWLAGRGLADVSGSNEVAPKPDMMRRLRQRETAHLAETLSRQLNAIHVPHEPGSRISGIYECAIATPTGRLAVIRSADTFTLAPWRPGSRPSNRCVAAPSWASLAPIASCGPSIAAARCPGEAEDRVAEPIESRQAGASPAGLVQQGNLQTNARRQEPVYGVPMRYDTWCRVADLRVDRSLGALRCGKPRSAFTHLAEVRYPPSRS